MKKKWHYLVGAGVCLTLVLSGMLAMALIGTLAGTPVLPANPAQAAGSITTDRGAADMGDPLAGYTFLLEIEGKTAGYFTECSGLGSENWVIEQKMTDEDGNAIYCKIPGRLKWSNIILKRGITANMDMWDWRQEVTDGEMEAARTNGSIIMLDRNMEPVAQWDFEDGWPCRIAGAYVAADLNESVIEEIEIAHEGLTRVE